MVSIKVGWNKTKGENEDAEKKIFKKRRIKRWIFKETKMNFKETKILAVPKEFFNQLWVHDY